MHNSKDRCVCCRRKEEMTMDIRCVMEGSPLPAYSGKLCSHESIVAHKSYSAGRELQLFNFRFGTQPAAYCFVV